MIKKPIICLILGIMILCFSGCNENKINSYQSENKEITQDKNIDEENGIIYKNNSITIVFKEDVSQKKINKIIKNIPGEIIDKSMSDLNIYPVKIKKSSLSEIKTLCKNLNKNKYIKNASPEYLTKLE